jgi:hypothetical protein
VWANVHGGVLAGLANIAFVFAGWLILSFTRYPSPVRTNRDRLWILGVGLACVLSVFCNPYGWKLPETWLTILSLSLPNIIEEHAPLNWKDSTGLFTAIWFGIYALTVLGIFRSPSRQDKSTAHWTDRFLYALPHVTWFLPLVWFYLAIDRVRNTPLFAVIAGIAVAEMLPSTRWRGWLEKDEWLVPRTLASPMRLRERVQRAGIETAAAVAVCSIVITTGWAKLSPVVWPTDLLPELAKMDRNSRPGTRIFNSMHDGGFLEFYCPRLKVFIDDRCELFGESMLREYAEAERNHPQQIGVWQKEYGFETAIVRNNTPFDHYLSKNSQWKLIRRGACASLFCITNEPTVLQDRHDATRL